MRRRQFLAATAATTLLPTVRADQPDGFEPLGTVTVDGIKEAVVGPDYEIVYAAASDGFATIDITDPASPTVLAQRRDLLADRDDGPLRQVFDAKIDGDYLVVVGPANPQLGGLNAAVFYDVADPSNPIQLGVYETDYSIHNCDFEDGIAYLTSNQRDRNELVLVEPCPEPERVGAWSIMDHDEEWFEVFPSVRTLHDVYVQEGRAYLAHWDAGTWIVDVADPTAPSFVARVNGRPVAELAALDQQQSRLEAVEPPGNDHYVAVDEAGSLLAIGKESWSLDRESGGPSGIELWDIETPTDPGQLATIEPPPSADPRFQGEWTTSHNFEFADGHLYTSWYQGGIKVYDVSDPAAPSEIAAWRDSATTNFWTAQDAGDVIVAASGDTPPQNLSISDRLYTFPLPEGVEPTEPPGTTGGPTNCPQVTPGADSTATATEPESTTNGSATETTEGSGAGFGVLAALAGLGIGAWNREN